jgi:Domain of unknown function (DUF4349)
MKKKIIIATASVAFICLGITGAFFIKNRASFKKIEGRSPSKPVDIIAGEREENRPAAEMDAMDGEFASKTRAAAPDLKNHDKDRFFSENRKIADAEVNLGKIFTPVVNGERRLEYNIAVNYQIDALKPARAFFNQWIPRYGFLLSESASGQHNGYMTLRVRVRSSNLYAALNDLDAIGALTSENITVMDHTENSVHQQMLAAREEIRKSRRTTANANTGTGSKNWEATENLLSQSEDKQLASRMEEWRIGDRTGWATLQITLSLPVVATPAPVEVPEFRNAFVGLLNVLLQLVYAMIYIVPLLLVGYAAYRGILRVLPAIRRTFSGGAA